MALVTPQWQDSNRMDNSLLLLKLQVLSMALDKISDYELHAEIIQQAELASAQAATTPFPRLVLPCLFEEKTLETLERQRCRKSEYWRQMTAA